VRQAGSNLIVDVTATAAYTGTFVGTSTINGTLIIHADGSASFHQTEVFTGTVNGVPGKVTFALNGSNDAALNVHATATIIDASGLRVPKTGFTLVHAAVLYSWMSPPRTFRRRTRSGTTTFSDAGGGSREGEPWWSERCGRCSL